MVVTPDVGFPDVEELLIAYLEQVAPTDTVFPEEISGKVIRIRRVGGSDDGITDRPRVQVSCAAPTRNEARAMAEQCRQLLLVLGGQAVEVPGLARPVPVDSCRTDTPPEPTPYDNPDVDRADAFYRLGLRRPRS